MLAFLCMAFLAARQYFVNYTGLFTVLCLVVLAAGALACQKEGSFFPAGAGGFAFVCGLVRLAGAPYFVNRLFVFAAVLWQILVLVPVLREKKGFSVCLTILTVLVNILVLLDVSSGSFYIRLMQRTAFHVQNSFDAPPEESVSLDGGVTLIRNISYHSAYPNGFLDVYLSQQAEKESCPTFLFVHGGGFTWGDKTDGDPNGGAGGGQQWYFAELLKAGYNIVSMNYALAPEYRYPTPVLQLCEAVSFLKVHDEEYGISMDRVIFSGGSAGGSIAGQFVCAQTDPDYSKKTGIPQVMDADRIRAVVFASALLDGTRYYKTGSVGFDFMLNECGRVYLGEDFATGKTAKETNLIDLVTAAFPPVYLSDGNNGSFTDQAADMEKRLQELGVPVTFTYYEENVETLGHGFEIFDTPCGKDNLARTIRFLDETVQ